MPIASAVTCGFFGHRNIAGSGADDGDASLCRYGAVAPEADRAGSGEILGFRERLRTALSAVPRSVRVMRTFPNALSQCVGNFDDTCSGVLPEAEDDFGHAVTQRTVVIDLGKAEIFEGQGAPSFAEAVSGDTAPS